MRQLKIIISFTLIIATLLFAVACKGNLPDDTQVTEPVTESSNETSDTQASSETTKPAPEEIKVPESIKILAIGNSYSDDAMAYLWDILRDAGCKEVIVANLYIGGCTLDKHYSNIQNNTAAYTYKKNSNGSFVNTKDSTIFKGLNDEKWDYITLQQGSAVSGLLDTYSHLDDIINTVKTTNPQATLYWHMTWAYQQGLAHSDFGNYNNDQMTMYSAIINVVNKKIVPNSNFTGIIPSGTTIQNMRTSYLGDTFARDQYHHMTRDYGRYSVGLTWAATILGEGVLDKIDWVPTSYSYVSSHLNLIKDSIRDALKTPLSITNSKYTENPFASNNSSNDSNILQNLNLDPSKYTSLLTADDWNKNAYYNTSSSSNWNVLNTESNSTSQNLQKFAATNMFTKEQLPVGSVIIVDTGYTYRPEGWISLTDKSLNTASRQGEVSTNVVVVDSAWWGSYTHRGFNLKHGDQTYSSNVEYLELISHLRIYVPAN